MPLTPPNYGPRPKQSTAIDNDGEPVEDGVPIVVEEGKVNFSTANIVNPQIMGGRLTLSSTNPIPEASIGSSGTLYYLPYIGNIVTLYDGVRWRHHTIPEAGIVKPLADFNIAIASGENYDVFLFDNNGVLDLFAVEWDSAATRNVPLVKFNGIYVRYLFPTHRYVGTFKANGNDTTIFTASQGGLGSTATKLYLYNMDNKVPYTSTYYPNGWFLNASPLSDISAQVFGPSGAPYTDMTMEYVVGLTDDMFEATASLNTRIQAHTSGSLIIAVSIGSSSCSILHNVSDGITVAALSVPNYGVLKAYCKQRFGAIGLQTIEPRYAVNASGAGTDTVFFDTGSFTNAGDQNIAFTTVTWH